jgi:hypothetical protein
LSSHEHGAIFRSGSQIESPNLGESGQVVVAPVEIVGCFVVAIDGIRDGANDTGRVATEGRGVFGKAATEGRGVFGTVTTEGRGVFGRFPMDGRDVAVTVMIDGRTVGERRDTMVGRQVGLLSIAKVGSTVGSIEGEFMIEIVGFELGSARVIAGEGANVGGLVGESVGGTTEVVVVKIVGLAVIWSGIPIEGRAVGGSLVGRMVGKLVGALDGRMVGGLVGGLVGALVGRVGARVGGSVGGGVKQLYPLIPQSQLLFTLTMTGQSSGQQSPPSQLHAALLVIRLQTPFPIYCK